ncbi:Holliday junction resolvase RuvX [Desulfonatronum thioautotrophicum]|uniref:Holliday junction resolvase RuvX n=1 Tax=Desulfonatronum thioautotrophicum TaxID=617001 RepID=UPI0005EBE5D6|nr:Holliday junction resolvase RuvX [Desulfonatronum thioautotrophicum]
MRVLGIDYGTKRVGLALSDGLGLLAYPYATLERTTRERLFAELLTIVAKEDVRTIVLGLPKSLNGEETETTRQVRNFAQSLRRRTDLPVVFQDEAFSSQEAERQLRAGGRRGRKVTSVLDQQAAVVILSDYLERTRPESFGKPENCKPD